MPKLLLLIGIFWLTCILSGIRILIRRRGLLSAVTFTLATLWLPFYSVGIKSSLSCFSDPICLSPLLWLPSFWLESMVSFVLMASLAILFRNQRKRSNKRLIVLILLTLIFSFGSIGTLRWKHTQRALAGEVIFSASGKMAALKLYESGFAGSTDSAILFSTDIKVWRAKKLTDFGFIINIRWTTDPENLIVISTYAYETSDEAVHESLFNTKGIRIHRTAIQNRVEQAR